MAKAEAVDLAKRVAELEAELESLQPLIVWALSLGRMAERLIPEPLQRLG